ncbi:MAG: glycoside hydrolase family 88 protein [Cyclobacteriaceae bacterium]
MILSGCSIENGEKEKLEAGPPNIPEKVVGRLEKLLAYQPDSTAFPRSMELSGETRGVPSKDWTSGFYVGSLLYSYQLTADKRFLDHAEKWLPYLEKEKENARTHDMGFKINCSYGNALQITKKDQYQKVLIKSAETLSTRYNTQVGCVKSWDFGKDKWDFPVIIDNMMNLELLFRASQLSGDSVYHKIAVSHADKTIENHFRPDHSSFHVIDYDHETGEVIKKLTHQGYGRESSWARGQAWGLYGFTMTYRFSGKIQHLDQARKIADFLLTHPGMPEDMIPYWDFDAPGIPDEPKDVSAATVMASAFIELYTFTDDDSYLRSANRILESLYSEQYMLNHSEKAPFILSKSTGNWPKSDEISVPISYADYYYLEALYRKNQLN